MNPDPIRTIGADLAIASVLALTAYALYTALAGRSLFKAGFLDSG